jgi:hypothetical protein
LAAKKPFLVATTAGQMVAVGETWPNESLGRGARGISAERHRLQYKRGR